MNFHPFSHHKFPKNTIPSPLTRNTDEMNQALKLLLVTHAVDLVLQLDILPRKILASSLLQDQILCSKISVTERLSRTMPVFYDGAFV